MPDSLVEDEDDYENDGSGTHSSYSRQSLRDKSSSAFHSRPLHYSITEADADDLIEMKPVITDVASANEIGERVTMPSVIDNRNSSITKIQRDNDMMKSLDNRNAKSGRI